MRKFKTDEVRQIEDIARKVISEMLSEAKSAKVGKKSDKKEAE